MKWKCWFDPGPVAAHFAIEFSGYEDEVRNAAQLMARIWGIEYCWMEELK